MAPDLLAEERGIASSGFAVRSCGHASREAASHPEQEHAFEVTGPMVFTRSGDTCTVVPQEHRIC